MVERRKRTSASLKKSRKDRFVLGSEMSAKDADVQAGQKRRDLVRLCNQTLTSPHQLMPRGNNRPQMIGFLI
jgi:hypothetical protein